MAGIHCAFIVAAGGLDPSPGHLLEGHKEVQQEDIPLQELNFNTVSESVLSVADIDGILSAFFRKLLNTNQIMHHTQWFSLPAGSLELGVQTH